MDHNSVLRPINELSKTGVTYTIVKANPETGIVDPSAIKKAISSTTRLVVVAHGSNVTGTIQDIKAIGAICGEIPFLVDAAQTMGHIPIDVQEMNIDLLAFPGHKGLLGPLGIGGLVLKTRRGKFTCSYKNWWNRKRKRTPCPTNNYAGQVRGGFTQYDWCRWSCREHKLDFVQRN